MKCSVCNHVWRCKTHEEAFFVGAGLILGLQRQTGASHHQVSRNFQDTLCAEHRGLLTLVLEKWTDIKRGLVL